MSEKVNQLSKTLKPDLQLLSKKVEKYFSLLADNRISDENIARKLNWGFLDIGNNCRTSNLIPKVEFQT